MSYYSGTQYDNRVVPPFTQHGRYVFGGNVLHAVSDDPNEATRLYRAWCARDGSGTYVHFTPGVSLTHIGRRTKYGSGQQLLLWSDDKIYMGTLYPTREPAPIMSEDAEWLLKQAIQTKQWANKKWHRFLPILSVAKDKLHEEGGSETGFSYSSSWSADIYKLTLTYVAHQEILYWCYLSAGSLGEDGDAWDESQVFETQEETAIWLKEQRDIYDPPQEVRAAQAEIFLRNSGYYDENDDDE